MGKKIISSNKKHRYQKCKIRKIERKMRKNGR